MPKADTGHNGINRFLGLQRERARKSKAQKSGAQSHRECLRTACPTTI